MGKKIGLFGISGVYNFGCEAIVRGSFKFLKDLYPDSRIIYYTYNYEYDKDRLKDIDIEIVPVARTIKLWKRVVNLILRKLNVEYQLLMFDATSIANQIDLLVSIGGDIYTIPQYLRERKVYPYHNELIDLANRCLKAGKEVWVYGASIGPFGNNKNAINYYAKNLSKYDKIICREQISVDYLHSIGVHNTLFMPDPAFLVDGNINQNKESVYIGINLSALSLKETIGEKHDAKIKELADFVEALYCNLKHPIMFLPHVVFGDGENDNDFLFMKRIYEELPKTIKDNVEIADYSRGFIGIKHSLMQCCMVISARMHCCVNAIHENIPTFFLVYSQKSKGMCQYVYGHEKWTLDITQVNADSIEEIKELYNERQQVGSYLEYRNSEIMNSYDLGVKEIRKKIV